MWPYSTFLNTTKSKGKAWGAVAGIVQHVAVGCLAAEGGAFHADSSDPSTAAKVRADVDLGNRLHISSTPTVFLNGRLLDRPARGVLDILIHYELLKASKTDES